MKRAIKLRYWIGNFLNNYFDYLYFVRKKHNPRVVACERLGNIQGNLVDLCTGTGANIKAIIKKNNIINIVGTDISRERIHYCKKKFYKSENPNITFSQMDCTALKYPNACFDYVTLGFAFHEMNSTTRKQVVNEVKRIIKQHGYFIVLDWNGLGTVQNRGKIRQRLLDKIESKYYQEYIHCNFTEFIENNGFCIKECIRTDFSDVMIFIKQ